MKPPSPLLGFNNNVRHKGRVFHIQTEDSGVRHPHIITHLFADGGRILKTAKTSYAEFLDTPSMQETVRQMMQEQHKAMFMALRDGQFDSLIDELTGKAPAARPSEVGKPSPSADVGRQSTLPSVTAAVSPAAAPAPQVVVAPPPPAVAVRPAEPARGPSLQAAPPAVSAPPIVSAPPAPAIVAPVIAPPPPSAPYGPDAIRVSSPAPPAPPAPPARPTPTRMPSARPRLDIDPAAIHRPPSRHPQPIVASINVVPEQSDATKSAKDDGSTGRRSSPGIDVETLERAAAAAETPFFQQIRDLPPPPAAVLGPRAPGPAAGAYSVGAPIPPPSTRGRYAPSRPSSIFAAARPNEGASIFGEDLISEKSLDEVILSYLAEDLDGPSEKK